MGVGNGCSELQLIWFEMVSNCMSHDRWPMFTSLQVAINFSQGVGHKQYLQIDFVNAIFYKFKLNQYNIV